MTIPYKKLQSVYESKHALPVLSVWDRTDTYPPQTVVITKSILDKFAGQTEVVLKDLVDAAVADTTGAVEEKFSITALNSINSLYYSSCEKAFHKHSDLANLYVKNRMVQHTLLQTILSNVSTKEIKIKEINAGETFSRWQHFSEYLPSDVSMNITIADLEEEIIQIDRINNLNLPRMTFKHERYDMREEFRVLPEDEKYDVMLTTYGFDSVWLDEDVVYYKKNNSWYQLSYRVKVTKDSKIREELVELLRKGVSSTPLPLYDFADIVVECIAQPVDPEKMLYKEEILKLYGSYEEARVLVPGSIVKRTKEAFEKQLKKDGVFIIGEVATYPIKAEEEIELTISDYHTTGKVAKYKVEDFYLGELILRDLGFKVEVHALADLAKKFGKTISDDTEDTWVMVVSR